MPDISRRARDLNLLDAIDKCAREKFDGPIWRVVRDGRDPLLGAASRSRWCDGACDVLYTSMERNGAIAEIYAFLTMQPVFPSKPRWFDYQLKATTERSLVFADLSSLGRFGVDAARYRERDYSATQAIADAACFLGFDGMIAQSARWNCQNLILFTDQIAPDKVEIAKKPNEALSWDAWRKTARV
ncbi:RES family NAD+ phosphorylase [uncultured Rhodoblastus sp.]|uniref:RES family NAD+ phosphorylase n=1 Tax=uncultured Rhodoblastus sp. TaxID=543037 RepID=UPI0025D5FA61|nr:RES family NAD+ phosphorylase [uncultured Rhodoblastus sp.]